jgi:MFS family permease
LQARSRLNFGWAVVGASAVGLALSGAPVVVYSFGIFLPSLASEFHVGRGAISFAFTLHNLVGAVVAPVVGRVADRYGARPVVMFGSSMLGVVGLSALAIRPHLMQLYVFYAALGIGTISTSPIAYGILIARWFDGRRGLALGLMMVGLGLSAIVMPPVVRALIANFGWRETFGIYGIAVFLVTLPIAMLLREPDGETRARTAPVQRGGAPGTPWSEIWRHKDFRVMLAAFFIAGAAVHACALHIPEILTDCGVALKVAALASSVTGVAVLVGRIGSGIILDRRFGPSVAMGFFALAALGFLLLAVSSNPSIAVFAAFLVGLSFGAEVDLIGFLLSRYFGLRALGTAFGVMFGAFVLAGGIGPFLMGIGFDETGSYRVPLLGFLVAMSIATALMSLLGAYRYAVASKDDHPIEAATV